MPGPSLGYIWPEKDPINLNQVDCKIIENQWFHGEGREAENTEHHMLSRMCIHFSSMICHKKGVASSCLFPIQILFLNWSMEMQGHIADALSIIPCAGIRILYRYSAYTQVTTYITCCLEHNPAFSNTWHPASYTFFLVIKNVAH